MKSLVCWLLLLGIAPAFSQEYSLDSDSIFNREIAINLRFTAEAQRLGKSVRVYIGFTVTKQGGYRDISIVNFGFVDESFKQEVKRVWSKLPNQNPNYAGHYVLPVAFLLGEGRLDHLKSVSNTGDTIAKEGKYKLLREVSVIGYLVCENKNVQ